MRRQIRTCQWGQAVAFDPETATQVCREEPVFDLDPQQLEQRYKGLQRLLHPDKFSTGAELCASFGAVQLQVVWLLRPDKFSTGA